MKFKITLLAAAFALFITGAFARITLQVDMKNAVNDTSFHFNTSTGFVDVDGNFTKWTGVKLARIGTSTVYTINFDTLKDGTALEFKFRANGSWTYAEFPKGGPNRKFAIKNGTVYSMQYNDTNVTKSIITGLDNQKDLATQVQLFPNPAADQVHITYDLAVTAPVSIHIYNVLGSEVKSYFAESQSAGVNNHAFDINDLHNGLYFYVLNVNGQPAESRKFQITK